MSVTVVTGTGTDVGKTVVTAALVACGLRAGRTVAVVKPIQTGTAPGAGGDLAEVRRLTGNPDLHEIARYTEPLAPETAARRLGEPGPTIRDLADGITAVTDRDLVVVEGAGGLLVRLNADHRTLLDVIDVLSADSGIDLRVILVATAELGVLNIAALTAAALSGRGIALHGVVIGSWPAQPDLAQRCNLTDLSRYTGAPIRGVLPAGAGRSTPAAFGEIAVRSLDSTLGGTLDIRSFIHTHGPSPREEISR